MRIHRSLFALGVVLWLAALMEIALLARTWYGLYALAAGFASVWFFVRMLEHIDRIHRKMRSDEQIKNNLPELRFPRHPKERGITYKLVRKPRMRVRT